jgi:hyperosmotically inducible protein
MNRLIPCAAALVLVAAVAGCTKSGTNSAYNNSGASSTPAQPASTVTTTTTSTTPSTDVSTSSTATTQTTGSTGNTNVVSDTVTTGKVKAAIASDSGLKDSDIVVKTDGGVVVLSGTAKSQDQITIATNLAKGQEGVNRVETQIVVR